jgi:hypothetical protein
VVGVLGLVVGAFVTQGFNLWLDNRRLKSQEAERERDRTHERDLRKLELDDAHRARLYDDRKAAYADFYRSYEEYRVAVKDQEGVPSETSGPGTEAWDKVVATRRTMHQKLQLIELATSPSVRDTAVEVRRCAWVREALGLAGGDFAELRRADKAVEEAEGRLREAIQVELELGR